MEAAQDTGPRHSALVVAGWFLVALTLVLPPLVLAAIGVGVVAARRGRFGTGVAIVVCALLALLAAVYLASQTLVPRD